MNNHAYRDNLFADLFLRGHISQLTQSISQFALKPGEEEIKKKGWWKFWR
jgi:hypothetical protein